MKRVVHSFRKKTIMVATLAILLATVSLPLPTKAQTCFGFPVCGAGMCYWGFYWSRCEPATQACGSYCNGCKIETYSCCPDCFLCECTGSCGSYQCPCPPTYSMVFEKYCGCLPSNCA